MGDKALTVEGLSKAYRVGSKDEQCETLYDAIKGWAKAPVANFRKIRDLQRFDSYDRPDVFWALKDISFELEKGEVLGVIGRNGAGKSTLLKVLCRITEPTRGQAEVCGRVGSLLEVGTGFHPDLTGRENVYLNGAILGMRKGEIDRKFDEIVDFAGVETFIDTPVKRYSSGMRMRLAFSVAAHLEPEILIIDEVLAVGDAEFQKKCLGKMKHVAGHGRTVLFVSHNMGAVSALCSKALVLDQGEIRFEGSATDGIAHYLRKVGENAAIPVGEREDRSGTQELKMTSVRFLNGAGESTDTIGAGDDLAIEIGYELSAPEIKNIHFQVNFVDSFGSILFTCFTKTLNTNFPLIKAGAKVRCSIPNLPLAPGNYTITLICKEAKAKLIDCVEAAAGFVVTSGDFFGSGRVTPADCGSFMVKHRWELVEA